MGYCGTGNFSEVIETDQKTVRTIKTYRIQLKPNNKQNTLLKKCADVARWAYNFALGRQLETYNNGGKFIPEGDLKKEITRIKKQSEYAWLNDVSAQIPKQSVIDCCNAYKRFFDIKEKRYSKKTIESAYRFNKELTVYGLDGHPKFKRKHDLKQGFYHRNEVNKLRFYDSKVYLERIGWVKLAENKPELCNAKKYSNPRICFDGFNWFITVGIDIEMNNEVAYTEGIGIDLGIKNLAVLSSGDKIDNINKISKIKKLENRLKRLQRKVSNKYENQKEGGENRYRKTKNMIKVEYLIRKTYKRLKDIRINYLHKKTTELVKTKPEYVVMEDLNVKGMVKNHKLAKSIQEQTFREFKRQMEYKCKWNGIKFITADRYFPSSKTCSECGYLLDKLSLSQRSWVCPECSAVHDRDINAAVNLMKYGKLA